MCWSRTKVFTYNVTLEIVEVGSARYGSAVARTIDGLLRRNGRIRRALEHLKPREYHVAPASLWPSTLEMVSRLPTLMYRFLRRGDLNALGDRLVQRSRACVPRQLAKWMGAKKKGDVSLLCKMYPSVNREPTAT
jgi:hypothetical protein